MSKGLNTLILLGGVIGIIVLMSPKAEAEEMPTHIPTVDEIMASNAIVRLEAYRNLINDLFLTRMIDQSTYQGLHDAYTVRFYELVE